MKLNMKRLILLSVCIMSLIGAYAQTSYTYYCKIYVDGGNLGYYTVNYNSSTQGYTCRNYLIFDFGDGNCSKGQNYSRNPTQAHKAPKSDFVLLDKTGNPIKFKTMTDVINRMVAYGWRVFHWNGGDSAVLSKTILDTPNKEDVLKGMPIKKAASANRLGEDWQP